MKRNDDVLFTFEANIEDSSARHGVIQWLRVRTQAGRTKYVEPAKFNFVNIELLPWTVGENRARISVSARVFMPSMKDGVLVAIQVENKHGERSTFRFSEYGDLLYTVIEDAFSKDVA